MSKKTRFIIMIAVVFLSAFLLITLSKKTTFKILESSSTAEMDVDVVFYPFSIGISEVNLDSYALTGNKAKLMKQDKDISLGYSSVINLEVLNEVYTYLKIESFIELEEMFGQYFSYRNYDGTQILVFYNWYERPNKLNVVIIKEDHDIHILTEVFDEEGFYPIAIKQCEDGALLILRKGFHFELRKINTAENKMTSANFTIDDIPESYYYVVDIVFSNDKLYFMTNRTVKEKKKLHNLEAYLFTFDMETNTLVTEKISDSKMDFFCGDDQTLCYGNLTEKNTLAVYQRDILTDEESEQEIKCVDDVKEIMPKAALYMDSQLYINLSVEDEKTDTGVLYRYDLNNSNLLNRYLYTYKGSVYMKYYKKGTSYTYDVRYATSR